MKTRTHCRNCHSTKLSWGFAIVNNSSVMQGRLTTHDVDGLFYLGCEDCGETVQTADADTIAKHLNETKG